MKFHPVFWVIIVFLFLLFSWFFYGNGNRGVPLGQNSGDSSSVKTSQALSEQERLVSVRPAEKTESKAAVNRYEKMAAETEEFNVENVEPDDLIRLLAEKKKEKFEKSEQNGVVLVADENKNDVDDSEQDAFETLFAMVEEAERLEDRDTALELLLALMEVTSGEDLQSVLKKMAEYVDEGGNEAIMEAFFSSEELAEIERFRMLSYINPDYSLSEESIVRLQNTYDQVEEKELQHEIVNVLAVAGGEDTVSWLIGKADSAADYTEWSNMIGSLRLTGSVDALQYLHESLNNLSPGSPEYEMHRQELRDAIASFPQ